MSKDPYEILQVASHAEQEVIEAAYSRLARKYHPDLNKSPLASERMRELNWAYGILSNPIKRAEYDRRIRSTGTTYDRTTSTPYSQRKEESRRETRTEERPRSTQPRYSQRQSTSFVNDNLKRAHNTQK